MATKRKRSAEADTNDRDHTKKQKIINAKSAKENETLTRTATVILPEPPTKSTKSGSTLIKRTSSLLAELDEKSNISKTPSNLEDELSEKSQAKLEKTLSSILMPTKSAKITIPTPVAFDVCTDFKLEGNYNKKRSQAKKQVSSTQTNEEENKMEVDEVEDLTVDDIPLELWVDILLRVPNVDRWHMAQTSQRFYQIFKYYVGYDELPYFSYMLYELLPNCQLPKLDPADKENLSTDCFEIATDVDFSTRHIPKPQSIVLFSKRVKTQWYAPPIQIDIIVIYKRQQESDLSSEREKAAELARSRNGNCDELVGLVESRNIYRDMALRRYYNGEDAKSFPHWIAYPHKIEKVICLNSESINNIEENMLIGYRDNFEHLYMNKRRPEVETKYAENFNTAKENDESEKDKEKRLKKLEESANIPTTSIADYPTTVNFVYNPSKFGVQVNHIIRTRIMRNKIYRNELSDFDKFTLLHAARKEAIHAGKSIQWPKSYHGLTKTTLPHPQPSGIRLKLYEYQLRGLSWMKTIEDNAMKKDYSFSVVIRGPAALDFFMKSGPFSDDLLPENFQIIDSKEAELQGATDNTDLLDSFRIRGGMLADEMGLGKTISMTSLIVANPRKEAPKDKKSKKEKEEAEEEELANYNPLDRIKAIFEIKATLIICPSQLVQQWASEMQKYSDLQVIEVTTIRDLRNITYQTIIDADVVVASHQFMQNASYKKLCGKWTGIQKKMQSSAGKIARSKYTPILQFFGWHRIILDEGHEILSETVTYKSKREKAIGNSVTIETQRACNKILFDSFLSNYRWYVTGTPFPRGRASIVGALNFLQCKLASLTELDEEIQYSTPVVYELPLFNAVKRCIFWRNTKASVKHQAKIPPIVEEVTYLKLSPVERAIYKSFELLNDKANMRLICSQPTTCSLISTECLKTNGFTPQLAINLMQQFNNKVINLRNSLRDTKEQLQKEYGLMEQLVSKHATAKKQLAKEKGSDAIEEQTKKVKKLQISLQNKEKVIDNTKNKIENLEESIIEKMAQATCFATVAYPAGAEFCFFCTHLLDESKKKIALLPCEHKFCKNCIYSHVFLHSNCPTCGVQATVSDLAFIESDSVIEDELRQRKEKLAELTKAEETKQTQRNKQAKATGKTIDTKLAAKETKVRIKLQHIQHIEDLEDLWNELKTFSGNALTELKKSCFMRTGTKEDALRAVFTRLIKERHYKSNTKLNTESSSDDDYNADDADYNDDNNNNNNSNNKNNNNSEKKIALSSLTVKYGTKFAALLHYVHGVIVAKKTKIIVFSKYDSLLANMTDALQNEANISYSEFVVCKGSVTQRNKAIAAFNSTDENSPHVLLLSLNNAVSGTHLTVASKIVLVDPVIGSKDEAQATDAQAIARSHRIGQDQQVTAVRFVVKNTIDEDDYNNAYGQDD